MLPPSRELPGKAFYGHGSRWDSAVVLSAQGSWLVKLPIVLIDLTGVLKYVYTLR